MNETYAEEVLKFISEDIKYLDYHKIILKCDQESSITALRDRVRLARAATGAQTIPEDAPKGESQANGVVEKAVQEVEDMVATLLSALEFRLDRRLPLDAPVLAWLVEYAATSINHFREGRDKKTPLERHRAMKHERPLADFGERVHYLPLDRKHGASHSPDVRYEEGIWLGLVMKSQEVIIGTPSGVVRARSVKRRPEDVRWSADEVMKIVGTPWNQVSSRTCFKHHFFLLQILMLFLPPLLRQSQDSWAEGPRSRQQTSSASTPRLGAEDARSWPSMAKPLMHTTTCAVRGLKGCFLSRRLASKELKEVMPELQMPHSERQKERQDRGRKSRRRMPPDPLPLKSLHPITSQPRSATEKIPPSSNREARESQRSFGNRMLA